MAALGAIRWARVLLGGLFIELAMFAIVIPLAIVSEPLVYYSVPILAIGVAAPVGWWVARRAGARFVAHGALTAAVASLIYLALTAIGGEGDVPVLYHVSNGLRLIGGAIGGWLAARSRAPAPAPALPL
jgi:hypothetical protein